MAMASKGDDDHALVTLHMIVKDVSFTSHNLRWNENQHLERGVLVQKKSALQT